MNALLLVSALALAPAAPLPKEAPLQWKLAKGDKFYTKSVQTMNQTITVLGTDMEQENEQVSYNKYEVKEASDKGYTIEQTTIKATAKGNIPGITDMADKMKDAKLTFVTDEKFDVKKVEGLDKMLEKLTDGNDQAKQMISSFVSEDLMKHAFTDVFKITPDKAVKKGDKWKKEGKYPMGPLGDFTLESEYVFAESDKTDKLTFKSEGKFALPKNADPNLPFTISKGELKMDKFEGELTFDSKAGRLKSSTTTSKSSGTLTISANGMDIELKLKQDVKAEVTLSDKNLADD
jgi:Family of unknown function (DUF6263)